MALDALLKIADAGEAFVALRRLESELSRFEKAHPAVYNDPDYLPVAVARLHASQVVDELVSGAAGATGAAGVAPGGRG